MRKIKSLPEDKLNEDAALIGESFWDYPYDKGEGGLKAFIPTRQGYMRKLLEFAYKMADKKKAACILDTDAMGKCERYIHLGMKLEQTREAAGYKVYDLIREAE